MSNYYDWIYINPREYLRHNWADDAQIYGNFRADVKKFLFENKAGFDKFTVTEDDAILGYISEHMMANWFYKQNCHVEMWGNNWDENTISDIINSGNPNTRDIEYVRNWFYDKYDLLVNGEKWDIKTAVTTVAGFVKNCKNC